MIPKPYIAKWQEHAPWKEFAQVEQDLIISRAPLSVGTLGVQKQFCDNIVDSPFKIGRELPMPIKRKEQVSEI